MNHTTLRFTHAHIQPSLLQVDPLNVAIALIARPWITANVTQTDTIAKTLIDQAGPQDRILQAALKLYAHTAHHRLWRVHDANDPTPLELLAPTDTLFLGPQSFSDNAPSAQQLFTQLRWGGQVVAAAGAKQEAHELEDALNRHGGFRIEQGPAALHAPVMGMRLPGISHQGFSLIARKVRLTPPGCDTNRCTYDIELVPAPTPEDLSSQVVRKTVPSAESLFDRLRHRAPNADPNSLLRRAHYLANEALPLFLTRESITLRHLQESLPVDMRKRVPRLVDMSVNASGQTQCLDTVWLAPGTQSVNRLDFILQLAELVAALHQDSQTLHLDLRLDNIVLSQDGVCLVDFGNAVQFHEDLTKQPNLKSLLDEVVQNSATRRDLKQMLEDKQINHLGYTQATSSPGIQTDAFYLALQASRTKLPTELARLVKNVIPSEARKPLQALTDAFLKPKNIKHEAFKTPQDFLRGIQRLHKRFGDHASDQVALAA